MYAHIFNHPFTCKIAGPSGSGKTELIVKILKDKEKFIYPPPEITTYYYSREQEAYERIRENDNSIIFREGLPGPRELEYAGRKLIILDDLAKKCAKSDYIMELFSVDSHHTDTSVIMLTQNYYDQGKNVRDQTLNSQYVIFTNNIADRQQIATFAVQAGRFKDIMESYREAVIEKKYGHLLYIRNQTVDEDHRIQSDICDEFRTVYIPKY